MLRSAIDWHSTSLKMLFEVSMLVAPDGRASHFAAMRQQSAKERRRASACAGLLQDTATNSAVACCGAQIEMIGRAVDGKPRRPRVEMQARWCATLPSRPMIFQNDVGGTGQLARADAAARRRSPRTSNRSAKSLSNSRERSKLAVRSP